MNDQTISGTHRKASARAEAPPDTNSEPPHRVALIAGDRGGEFAQLLLRHGGPALAGHALELVSDARELMSGRHDLVHALDSGQVALAAVELAQMLGLPVAAGDVATRCTEARVDSIAGDRSRRLYARSSLVLSPDEAADRSLLALGLPPERIGRWERGVDLERFHPARFAAGALGANRFNILYAGPLSREHGTELLVESFLLAHDRDPRLHLVLAGSGAAQAALERRLGIAATFVGPLDADKLARVYASADLLLFASRTDAYGQAILEAQASGLPVLAVAGAATTLIEDGRSGCVVPAEAEALGCVIRSLTRRDAMRDRLATGGLLAVRGRTWERSLQQLAAAYRAAVLAPRATQTGAVRAA